ncbi:hypothetical protein SAMN05661080_03692 [Modestobacter sp. DSM 44400]|nr:hypothetical protein SAMN05661080_03692 [Modestobacter sp. DSM 44400]
MLGSVFTSRAAAVLTDSGAPDPAGTVSALTAGQAGQVIGAAPARSRGDVADLLASAYAGGLRDVFLVSGAAGIVGGLLAIALVRAAAPSAGHQPAQQPAAEHATR